MRNIILILSPFFIALNVISMDNRIENAEPFDTLFDPLRLEFIKNEILRTNPEFNQHIRNDLEYWDETFASATLSTPLINAIPVATPIPASQTITDKLKIPSNSKVKRLTDKSKCGKKPRVKKILRNLGKK